MQIVWKNGGVIHFETSFRICVDKTAAVAMSILLLCGASFAGAYVGGKQTAESALNPSVVSVTAANAQPVVEQKTVAPIILKNQGQFRECSAFKKFGKELLHTVMAA